MLPAVDKLRAVMTGKFNGDQVMALVKDIDAADVHLCTLETELMRLRAAAELNAP